MESGPHFHLIAASKAVSPSPVTSEVWVLELQHVDLGNPFPSTACTLTAEASTCEEGWGGCVGGHRGEGRREGRVKPLAAGSVPASPRGALVRVLAGEESERNSLDLWVGIDSPPFCSFLCLGYKLSRVEY